MKQKQNPFQVETAEDSTGFLLWKVSNLWQREIKKALEPFDLTHSQFVLLASILWLELQKGTLTQIDVSNHTGIDPMTTSSVLRTLEKKGLLKRVEDASDSRAKNIALTTKGISTAKKAILSVESFDFQFFSKLKAQTKSFNKNLIELLGD